MHIYIYINIIIDEIEECSWKKLKDMEFQEYHKKKSMLLKKIKSLKCNNCPDFDDHVNYYYYD